MDNIDVVMIMIQRYSQIVCGKHSANVGESSLWAASAPWDPHRHISGETYICLTNLGSTKSRNDVPGLHCELLSVVGPWLP